MPPPFPPPFDSVASSSFQGGTFGRSPPETLTVTLTSNTCSDRRSLQLEPGIALKIGRSSRATFRNLRQSEDNALFDCPVVSRSHAELRLSPWQRQVTIADKSSLHGTSVNGHRLNSQTPFTLKSGDIIKLGDRVARGEDAHDGVSLTFDILNEDLSLVAAAGEMQSQYNTSPTRGFYVPDESEHSDYNSELESIDGEHESIDGEHEHSSAKTTPQSKPGSQDQPIDLEHSSPRNIADLMNNHEESDNEAIIYSRQPRAFSYTIPESIDSGSILAVDSIPGLAEAANQTFNPRHGSNLVDETQNSFNRMQEPRDVDQDSYEGVMLDVQSHAAHDHTGPTRLLPQPSSPVSYEDPWADEYTGAAPLLGIHGAAPMQQQNSPGCATTNAGGVPSNATVVDASSATSSSKGKMPITAILGEEEPEATALAVTTSANDPEMKSVYPKSNKRKASNSEVDEADSADIAPPAKKAAKEAPSIDQPLRPIAKGRASAVAKEVGKVAVSAIGGAVALGAFLSSSYADQLINYLG